MSETHLDHREIDTLDKKVSSINESCGSEKELDSKGVYNLKYLIVGVLFGIVFVKSEVISWFRIQEMFRLQSFHMYGIIGSAVVVAAISVFLIKKFKVKTLRESPLFSSQKLLAKGRSMEVYFLVLDGR